MPEEPAAGDPSEGRQDGEAPSGARTPVGARATRRLIAMTVVVLAAVTVLLVVVLALGQG